MAGGKPKDNSTYFKKLQLRRQALGQMSDPVVMETHGGLGKLYDRLYAHLPTGVVFEKKPEKAAALAKQRPTWAVYECDCVRALKEGVGAHLPVNFLDVDPYGEPWSTIEAFLVSDRPKPETVHIVVNDGQRQSVQLGCAWNCPTLEMIVQAYGNSIYDDYLDVCKILMDELTAQAGYRLSRWAGYYCGFSKQMTHYWAVLEQR